MSWTDERIEQPEGDVGQGRDRQPDRRRAGRGQPQCRDRQGAPPWPRAAPLAGQAGRGKGQEAGQGRAPKAAAPAKAAAAPAPMPQPRQRPATRRSAAQRRTGTPFAPGAVPAPIRRPLRAGNAISLDRSRRLHPPGPGRPAGADPARARRAAWCRPSRAPRSPTRPACSISTTASANGRWAIRASPTSTSAASSANPGFPYCVDHCGVAYQAQLPRRDRRPPPPLPFGGPRVR